MRGLVYKIWRETSTMTGLFAAALFAVTALLTYILPQLQDGFGDIFKQIPIARRMVSALLSTEIGDTLSAQMMQAILWVHPVILTTVFGFVIVFCTRTPAGEVDRGTIDILLGWPIGRRTVYLTETAYVLAAGVFLMICGWLGHLVASPAMPPEIRPRGMQVIVVYLNFYCVFVAVAGAAFLVSALSDRRGKAVGIVTTFVVASFLLKFIAQFFEPAKHVVFLSVLDYYQPANVLSSNGFPAGDMAVLLAMGVGAWAIGGEILARRSLCTT